MSAKVKGVVLASRKKLVIDRFGADAWAKIVATLPPDDRELLDGIILQAGWYAADATARLDAAIVSVMGGLSDEAFRELGRQSAAQNLAKLHAGYVRGKSPMAFLEQTPAIYRQYYESGWREFQATGSKSGTIITHEADGVTEADCLTVMGWYEKAMEMAGARNPVMTHPICRARGGAVCRYELSWT